MHFNEPKQVMNENVLKKELSKEMKKRIEKSIQLVQKYKVDVLELGEVYKRHNYKEWRKSVRIGIKAEYFSNAEITVYVHPTIEHSGSALPKKVK